MPQRRPPSSVADARLLMGASRAWTAAVEMATARAALHPTGALAGERVTAVVVATVAVLGEGAAFVARRGDSHLCRGGHCGSAFGISFVVDRGGRAAAVQ